MHSVIVVWGAGFGCNGVTGVRRVCSRPVARRFAVTVGGIVNFLDTVAKSPVRALIALAVVFWLAVAGGLWDQSRAEIAPAHAPHALSTHWPAEVGAPTDHEHPIVAHPHAQDGSGPAAPETVGAAVLRRASTGLVAFGLVVVASMVAPLWCQPWRAAVRGPPRGSAQPFAHRNILTRLCIARR